MYNIRVEILSITVIYSVRFLSFMRYCPKTLGTNVIYNSAKRFYLLINLSLSLYIYIYIYQEFLIFSFNYGLGPIFFAVFSDLFYLPFFSNLENLGDSFFPKMYCFYYKKSDFFFLAFLLFIFIFIIISFFFFFFISLYLLPPLFFLFLLNIPFSFFLSFFLLIHPTFSFSLPLSCLPLLCTLYLFLSPTVFFFPFKTNSRPNTLFTRFRFSTLFLSLILPLACSEHSSPQCN